MNSTIFDSKDLKNLKEKADNGDTNACIELVDKLLTDKSSNYTSIQPFDEGSNFRLNQMQEYLIEDYVNARESNGKPSPEHFKAAFLYSKKAAELGDVEGMYRLAWRYELGEGTPMSRDNAMFWWKKGMKKGHSMSSEEYKYRRGFFESIGDLFE